MKTGPAHEASPRAGRREKRHPATARGAVLCY